MASQDAESGQGQQKVVLKRKLTGPPRLLLGKAKNVNQGGNRSDVRAQRNQRRMDLNGMLQDPSPKPPHDNMTNKEDTEFTQPPEDSQTSAQEEVEVAQPPILQTDCDANEEDIERERMPDINRKRKMSAKNRLGLRRLIPCMFACIRGQSKRGDLEIYEEGTETRQSAGFSSEDIQSTGDTVTSDAVCHSTCSADSESVTRNRRERGRSKNFLFPRLGRLALTGRCAAKSAQPLADIPGKQKKSLQSRIWRFCMRADKSVSTKESQSIAAPAPVLDLEVREEDCHLRNNQDLSRVHEEDTPQAENGVKVELGCPDAETVSADVSDTIALNSDHESQGHDTVACFKTLEDVTWTEADRQPEANQMDTQESIQGDLKESSGFSVDTSLTCSAVFSSGIQPQIDISLDEAFQSCSDETESIDVSNETSENFDHQHHGSLAQYRGSSDMCFLTVPVDMCWSPHDPNSKDVQPVCNTNNLIKPHEDTNHLSPEGLLILTANSLVQAAIKRALCQLSREVQPPLTNSHRDDCVHNEDA